MRRIRTFSETNGKDQEFFLDFRKNLGLEIAAGMKTSFRKAGVLKPINSQ